MMLAFALAAKPASLLLSQKALWYNCAELWGAGNGGNDAPGFQ